MALRYAAKCDRPRLWSASRDFPSCADIGSHLQCSYGHGEKEGTSSFNRRFRDTAGSRPADEHACPGAMGESHQVDKGTADTEAENRRVVVRILQNKGIAGL